MIIHFGQVPKHKSIIMLSMNTLIIQGGDRVPDHNVVDQKSLTWDKSLSLRFGIKV